MAPQTGIRSTVWLIDEDEILNPATRSVNYRTAHSRRLSKPWSIRVWLSPGHEEPGTLDGDWPALQMPPASGSVGKVLTEWGETLSYVRTAANQYWLAWYDGIVLKVYGDTATGSSEPWRFRPVLWSERRPVAELLGSTVFLWPRTEDGHMLPLSEPLLVTSVLWDAAPDHRRPGLGLTPLEASGATGMLDTYRNWPIRELRNLPSSAKDRALTKMDAVQPAIVLWHNPGKGEEKPFDLALRSVKEYASNVPTWSPVGKRDLPFHSLRLAVFDELGAHPLIWEDHRVPDILRAQFREAMQERGVTGMCVVCAEEGSPGVPESMPESGLCTMHRARRRHLSNKQARGAITSGGKAMFRFNIDEAMEEDID